MILTAAIDAVIVAGLLKAYQKDYLRGLNYSLFLLILLPQSLGIAVASLPVLTTHRVILIVCFIYWIRTPGIKPRKDRLKDLLLLLVLVNLVSLIFADYFLPALKRNIGFIMEGFFIYYLVLTSIREKGQIEKTISWIYLSVMMLTAIGLLERLTSLRLLAYLPAFTDLELERATSYATLPHPIFLGLASATALVLTLYYSSREENRNRKTLFFFLTVMCGSVLYFTVRRGPWLAGLIGASLLFVFSSRRIRNILILAALAAGAIVLMRPGVYDTIRGYYDATLNPRSLEGASYFYRLELWILAFRLIRASPLRFLLGYGMEYHRYADLFGEFTLIQGRRSAFESWDNELAVVLLESGMLGFVLFVLFLAGVVMMFLAGRRKVGAEARQLINTLFVCVFMTIFMMSNVKMFSTQILFIFYSFVAFGSTLLRGPASASRHSSAIPAS